MQTVYFVKSGSVSREREWDEGGVTVIRSFVFGLKGEK